MKVFRCSRNYLNFTIEILGIKFLIPCHRKDRIAQNKRDILKKLKAKYGKEKIKVGFLVNELSKWKYQSLYNTLDQNDNFEPVILVTELRGYRGKDKNYHNKIEECYDYFKSKNLNVRYVYDIKHSKYLPCKEFGVDILFYEQPWNLDIIQRPDYASQYALTCYSSYGMNLVEFPIEYTYKFYTLLWTMFVENEGIASYFSKLSNNKENNYHGVGCPMLDEYHNVKSDKNKTKPLIIYAPHHSLENDSLRCATFHKNGKEILNIAKKYSDKIDWIFKPHPRLKQAVIQNKIMTESEVEDYYKQWQQLGRVVEDSDYINLFYNSDALITDSISFLGEYLPSKHPVLHLLSDNYLFNEFGKSFIESYYQIHNIEELYNTFEEVIIKKNDYKKEERLSKIPLVFDEKSTSTEKIMDYLIKSIKGENHMPKISVIIPVYNVEKYLTCCLDSILAQTFTDFEVICINDGSSDGSADILAKYALKDKRIQVITQENQGLSVARNNGLKKACGQYIQFLDSDDCIHPQTLEILYYIITKHNADMVCFDFVKNKDKGLPSITPLNFNDVKFKVTNNPLYLKKFPISVCIKLYKKELLTGLKFIEHIHFEDYPYTLALLTKHPKTIILKETLYFYTVDENSISHSKVKPQQIKDYHTGLRFVYETYHKPELKAEFRYICRTYIPNLLKQQLVRCQRADEKVKSQMFQAFAEELADLKSKGMLSWRGHKFTRYIKYLCLIKQMKK